ncbi:hypothetical protein BDC45DRAFT_416175, partial [Circinella umbellata]
LYGHSPSLPSTTAIEAPTKVTYTTQQWVNYLNHYLPIIHNNIKQNLQKAQARQARHYN